MAVYPDRQSADRTEVLLEDAFERARKIAVANERRLGTITVLLETKRAFLKVYGNVDLATPLNDDLVAFKTTFSHKAANTVNKWLRSFKRVCRVNGLQPKIEMRKVPKKKVDALTEEDIVLLIRCSGHLFPILLFAIDTGARRSEVASLKWDNVNLEKRRAIVEDAKSGDERVVPLSNRVVEAIKDLPRGTYVFRVNVRVDRPYDPNALSRAVRKIYEKAGLRDKDAKGRGARRSMHTLRKSFATRASAKGVPLKTTMAIGGWKQTSTMLNYYVDVSEESMEEAIDKLSEDKSED